MNTVYPDRAADRTQWILDQRGPRNILDPYRPYACFVEDEIGDDGQMYATGTVLLTNRECPYRCLMCDLWQNTLTETVPSGAIAEQIRYAIDSMQPFRQLKLYNAGSFFDPRAIPLSEDVAIAKLIGEYDRTIVEAHPAFIGERTAEFSKKLSGKLEVAIGLETVHEPTLDKLNKRFKLSDFHRSADFLKSNDIDLRVFLLVRPPFMSEDEGIEWACKSIDYSFDLGATACCLIPTRAGNGAMEALAENGAFNPPNLRSLEMAHQYGIQLNRGRIFADLWDIEKFYNCECSPMVAARIKRMNETQSTQTKVTCPICGVT